MADIYLSLRMLVIADMLPRAVKIEKIENEIQALKRQIDKQHAKMHKAYQVF